ncbi:MAG: SH3 domain-containing protein [Clostridia bacterium]|nr:SH3 domain-containing protein [Clostridia bacterium]
MRRAFAFIMTLAIVASFCVIIPVASRAELVTMYVITSPGRRLNVRTGPGEQYPSVAKLDRGTAVDVEFIGASGWAVIMYKGEERYVWGRYLSDNKPSDPQPAPSGDKAQKEAQELKNEQRKLNNELASEHEVNPFYVTVRTTRTSGWINFRVGPGKITTRITSFGDGKQLYVVGETNKWYKARDLETGKTGYIFKDYTTVVTPVVSVAPQANDNTQQLGTLNVNGAFDLTCRVPAGYEMQVVNMRGTQIVASVKPTDDMTRPQLYLSIAYDDSYSDVDRMNDLSEEDLAAIEKSFRDMNDVEISYTATGHGTKLMVVRETGSDTDFVDILTIYKGYFIEFNMTPSTNAAAQTLTNEQIGMCVDFLTDLDFVAKN